MQKYIIRAILPDGRSAYYSGGYYEGSATFNTQLYDATMYKDRTDVQLMQEILSDRYRSLVFVVVPVQVEITIL